MHFIDWLIVLVPLVIVFWVAIKAQKHVKGVADFLTAGRVAGRYVLTVAGGEAAMGLISLVALFEVYYNSGFAYAFWGQVTTVFGIVFTLTGYCTYRFRETRAMTMGQFLEMRYSRKLRIFAAGLQSLSGILNYAIFPAVGARFLIYYCDLPLRVHLAGMSVSTFGLVMALCLGIAVIIITMGGQITIMVTDCIQGLLSYPMYGIVVIYLLLQFSWSGDMAPTMLDRAPGKSMLNPFDISSLRDFNLFYVLVGVVGMFFGRMSWGGTQGYNGAAINAHEQKMGGVLGMWRAGFSGMMYVVLAVVAYTFLNNARFADQAEVCRQELAWKTVNDVAPAESFREVRGELRDYLQTGVASAALQTRVGKVDMTGQERVHDVVKAAIASEDPAKAQTFGAISRQMRVPMALRHILPVGIMGVFCALCVFLMVSTDTTYMHSWGSIIVQDIVVPLRGGRPLTPQRQLLLLRLSITGVALFAFLFSFYFAQIDFILMFFMITGALWAGAGVVITCGLYWRRGTTAAAFTALLVGGGGAMSGFIAQKAWVPAIYPWLEARGLLPWVTKLVEGASRPFEPYILWRITPERFPINSQELAFLNMLICVGLYVGISLLTCKQPFNLERLLHRGSYTRPGDQVFVSVPLTFRNALQKLVGIDPQYTRGDKALAWSVFIYSVIWGFGSFVVLIVWNMIAPWPSHWWANWFAFTYLILAGIIAVISTVWFTIGGVWDLRRLFKRLAAADRTENVLDDGRVVGHISADDVALVEKVEHTTPGETGPTERKPEDTLRKKD